MAITFEQITYRYKDRALTQLALDHIDLTLQAGQFITIVGAPGSGKSTLLQHMNGLLRADYGRIHLLDMDISPAPTKLPKALRQRVGLVFQYPEQQLFQLTIWDDLLYGPLNFEASRSEAELAAKAAAQFMGLDDMLLSKRPDQLSSGQLRKAAIAAVLAAKPEVIVLDEPTASLDALSSIELMELLHQQCRQQQRTVIVVTHSLEEVLPYSDHIVVLDGGKVRYSGKPHQLMQRQDILDSAGLQMPSSYNILFALQDALKNALEGDQLQQALGIAELQQALSINEIEQAPAATELAATIKAIIRANYT